MEYVELSYTMLLYMVPRFVQLTIMIRLTKRF